MHHDARYEDLDALDDYKLEHGSQDIRGRPLVGPAGENYGIIKDLLVGRDHGRVEAVRLDNGKVCAVEPLEIHDDRVIYGDRAVAHARTAGSVRS
ncbi:PRC-barrel domain-containing protein [Pseudopontixanthobacter vadosimaris]|uniref:PRC-barrel domain-containing protein n=1 Tax=Pseudopontixanthobacter vadosimaris TaxID=2726450 RepID=UPI0014745E68|nr:PRC-barrel domain-containing protein [Pseudopontixanthobacter vadosimaris]